MQHHLIEEDINLLTMKTFRKQTQLIPETELEQHTNVYSLITNPNKSSGADEEETEIDEYSDPLDILIAREEGRS